MSRHDWPSELVSDYSPSSPATPSTCSPLPLLCLLPEDFPPSLSSYSNEAFSVGLCLFKFAALPPHPPLNPPLPDCSDLALPIPLPCFIFLHSSYDHYVIYFLISFPSRIKSSMRKRILSVSFTYILRA